MDKPLVSVIIPAYNSADVIGDTLESVLNQSYGNVEAVVVDDGSADGTRKFVEGFTGTGKVKCYQQENAGPGAARNSGIRVAKGEFIAFLDADDFLTPDSIEKRMALITEAKGLELVYANYFVKWSDELVRVRFTDDYPGKFDSSHKQCMHGVVFEGSPADIFEIPFDFWTAVVLADRKLLDRTGLFRTDISIGEDRDMWIRLALNAGKIGYVRSPIATYNRSTNSLTGQDAVRYSMARRDLNYDFLAKYGTSIQGGKPRKVVHEKLSWVYYDLGTHYRNNGMMGRAIVNFLKSIYFSPRNELPYREIASSILPSGLRNRLKQVVNPHD